MDGVLEPGQVGGREALGAEGGGGEGVLEADLVRGRLPAVARQLLPQPLLVVHPLLGAVGEGVVAVGLGGVVVWAWEGG